MKTSEAVESLNCASGTDQLALLAIAEVPGALQTIVAGAVELALICRQRSIRVMEVTAGVPSAGYVAEFSDPSKITDFGYMWGETPADAIAALAAH